MKQILFIIGATLVLGSCNLQKAKRIELSLNGTWELSVTDSITIQPNTFNSTVPVPGLIDMAIPAVLPDEPIIYENNVYWYKKIFKVNHSKSSIVKLRINKAKYNTKVILNNKLVGENNYCFTPTIFDIKSFLNNSDSTNTLLIAIGSFNNLPDTVINGNDFEKTKYIPGIYDDVKLILTNAPQQYIAYSY